MRGYGGRRQGLARVVGWLAHGVPLRPQPVEKLGLRLCDGVLSGPGHGSAALAKALRGVREDPKASGEDFFNRLAHYRNAARYRSRTAMAAIACRRSGCKPGEDHAHDPARSQKSMAAVSSRV